MEFNVGDRVIIREWDDMEGEFGLDSADDIDCHFTFTEEMRCLCSHSGTIAEVKYGRIFIEFDDEEINSFAKKFSFSSDMLSLETENSAPVLCGDIMELLGMQGG